MNKNKALIADLELLSQKISEDVNKYLLKITELDKEIQRLNYLFDSKKHLLNIERSRYPSRRNQSSSPPSTLVGPKRRMDQLGSNELSSHI